MFPRSSYSILNSSEEFSGDEDFFNVLAENGTSRNVTLAVSIICQLIIPPGLLSIIIYEKFGSDKKRTFANKMTSSICWSGLAWGLLVHIPWIFRIILGRFSATTCFLMMLFRTAITNQVINLGIKSSGPTQINILIYFANGLCCFRF